jgi:hypothetical protein
MYVFWDQVYCVNMTEEGLARASVSIYMYMYINTTVRICLQSPSKIVILFKHVNE